MGLGLNEGTLLDERYRLRRPLGAGGMATVWLGGDLRLGRDVAIKVLADNLAADQSYVQRFHREAKVAASLSHPNLVAVYDFGEESGSPYLVMEVVEGDTLAAQVESGTTNQLDPLKTARELLGALEHVHRAGIIHRDIKPANVLLSPEGVKLTDFGIAQPENATKLTRTGLVVGTRNYIAPEVMRGEQATVSSDLYACGILLRESFDRVPGALGALITGLTQEAPDLRPESASTALSVIDATGVPTAHATASTELLEGEKTAATVPLPRTGLLKSLNWRVMIGLGLAFLTLLAVVALLSDGDAPEQGTGESVESSSPEQTPSAAGTTSGAGDSAEAPDAQVTDQPAPDEGSTSPAPPQEEAPGGTGNPGKPEKDPPGKAKGKGKP